MIRDGTYRERVVIKCSGTGPQPIKFQAAPGANVVITGADQCSGWKRMPGQSPVYSIPWPHRFITWSKQMTHPDDEYHRLIGRSEQLAVENYLLRQVLDVAQLAPGTFWVDTSNQLLQAWDAGSRDLTKVPAEASVRTEVVRVEGEYVQLRGLHFRYAANMAQHGAVALMGAHDIMEDCVVENMNASGAVFSAAGQVIRL